MHCFFCLFVCFHNHCLSTSCWDNCGFSCCVSFVNLQSSPFKRARTEKYGQGLEEKKEDHGVDVSDFEDEDPWDVSIHQGIDEG